MFTVEEQLVSELSTQPALAPIHVDGALPSARFNIGPTQPVVALARGENPDGSPMSGSVAAAVRWGLVPHWAKSMPKTPYFNARAETWREKPVFRDARPCVIPMNGWYEWKNKQPYFVSFAPGALSTTDAALALPEAADMATLADAPLVNVAGLWARCGDLVSCTIVTTDAVGHLSELHHRMPRVLADAELEAWLDHTDWARSGEVGLTDPAVVEKLQLRAANRSVGNIANEGAWLLTP